MSWYNPLDWDNPLDWGDVENFGTGALTGAATGFSVGGPWGALAGAGAGGIGNAALGGKLTGSGGGSGGGGGAAGMINPTPQQYGYAIDQYNKLLNQGAPTINGAQLDPSQMAQSRQGVMGVANRLGGIAAGTQQGAGEMAVNAQLGRATAAQTAAARMAHGANAALAARNAARNTMDLGLAGAGQAGQARMQDQQAANAQLGSLYGNLYGQDAGVAAQNAQLAQAAQVANQQAAQQTQAQRIQALGSMLGWDQTTINAQIAQANASIAQQNANSNQPNLLGNLLKGAGTLAQMYQTYKGTGGGNVAGGGGSGPITSPSQVA
jgi:hypothetical protein